MRMYSAMVNGNNKMFNGKGRPNPQASWKYRPSSAIE